MRLVKIDQVELGEALTIGNWRSGVCPWDRSSYDNGRSGHQQRTCDECGTTFEDPCPNCRNTQDSLGYNEELDVWGCDQCGSIFKELP